MDQSESIQNDQSIYESEIFFEPDLNEHIQNDQSICDNCESDYENDTNDQSDQELALFNNKKKSKIITKPKPSFKSYWLNEFKWLQYDRVSQRMFLDKESGQLTQQHTNHIIGVIKIVYTLIKQEIALAKLPYFVQMSYELESPFIVDGSITYENEVSGHEFAFAISNIIKAEIWEEIRESVSFGIMIDESTDISTNKHIDIYIMYPNISGNIKTHFLQLLALEQSDTKQSLQTLACKDSQKQLDYFIIAEATIKDVYKFYKNSAKRINILQEYQQILDFPKLRLKKLKEIRWLG
ncbi:9312_t:CDS:2 [Dentiscutata erythropus]|uniref:9312_t:CDS:1 n=1 Tax=Dentiscutata erythropus TaxID=1348616 RepID=A0A9N9AJ39_9GLOM|nr:9312_t:CDS:2 [Dentiscutata erythropus]